MSEFDDLIGKIAAQGDRQTLLEHFKGAFAGAIGAPHIWSSDEGWAYTDLFNSMSYAARNPPLFLQAFYEGCESLREDESLEIPDVRLMNEILRTHQVLTRSALLVWCAYKA